MTTALATTNGVGLAEQVAIAGDLAKLTPDQRMSYYGEVCRSMGLNPLTRPFEYIVLNDKLTLYARRDATDQLRKIHGVNISIIARETVEGVYVVTARATTAEGRSDESVGAVPLVKEDGEWQVSQNGRRYFKGNGQYRPLGPEERANAMMKAETKAKRRVTLSVVGLGWLDETELETVPSARNVQVDRTTGEIRDIAPDAGPPASDKQRGFIAGLQEKLCWSSEQLAVYFDEQKIDPVTMTKTEASLIIEQLQVLVAESTKAPVDELGQIADDVKRLREVERQVAAEPPAFAWNKKQGLAPLVAERALSRQRLYNWLEGKAQGLPALSDLDDATLIDTAYTAAGL